MMNRSELYGAITKALQNHSWIQVKNYMKQKYGTHNWDRLDLNQLSEMLKYLGGKEE